MHADRLPWIRGVNAGVGEALRAHVRIRRAEGVDADDLRFEVTKWWDGDDRLALPVGPSAAIPCGGLEDWAEFGANTRAPVRVGTRTLAPGGRS